MVLGGGSENIDREPVAVRNKVDFTNMETTPVSGVRSLQLKEYIGSCTTDTTNHSNVLIGANRILINDRIVIWGG